MGSLRMVSNQSMNSGFDGNVRGEFAEVPIEKEQIR
jgi:hypothetical protein